MNPSQESIYILDSLLDHWNELAATLGEAWPQFAAEIGAALQLVSEAEDEAQFIFRVNQLMQVGLNSPGAAIFRQILRESQATAVETVELRGPFRHMLPKGVDAATPEAMTLAFSLPQFLRKLKAEITTRTSASSPFTQLRLETALPTKVTQHHPFDLAVAILQPESPPLEEEGLDNIKTGEARVKWPEEVDSIALRIEVSAPTCEIHGSDQRQFRLYKEQDSTPVYFQLTPQQVGRVGIVVTVYHEREMMVGNTRLSTVAEEQVVGEVETAVYSHPLGITHEALVRFTRELEERTNTPELRVLCADLQVKYDNLRGEIHAEKVHELVDHMVRHGRFEALLEQCQQRFPAVDWRLLVG